MKISEYKKLNSEIVKENQGRIKVLSDLYEGEFQFRINGVKMAHVSFAKDEIEIEIDAIMRLSEAKDLAKWILSLED